MSNAYTRSLTTVTKTPQTRAIPGREAEMERNNAGGVAFTLDAISQLRRFLILGTEGGTYYTSEPKLTADNAKVATKLCAERPAEVADALIWASKNAPRAEAQLFVLAILASTKTAEARVAAQRAFNSVVKTGTHLYHFVNYVKLLGTRGWGRSLRSLVGSYFDRDVNNLALHAVKYRQRDGWTYRDVLRLAHPSPQTPAHAEVFKFMLDKGWDDFTAPSILSNYKLATAASSDGELVALAHSGLPWEAFRDEQRTPAVWKAMLPNQGVTAVVRNLSTLARKGLLGDPEVIRILEQKLSQESVVRSGVHPLRFLDALLVHRSGGQAGLAAQWRRSSDIPTHIYTPNKRVLELLEAAVGYAFDGQKPTGKKLLVALDVSGSMSGAMCAGSVLLDARMASAVMAKQHLKDESYLVGFTSTGWQHGGRSRWGHLYPATIEVLDKSKFSDYGTAVKYVDGLPMGGTDCALPMLYATANNLDVDAFIVYTDNETWAGSVQPAEALREYRIKSGRKAKLIVVATSVTNFSIADPKDAGMLDVVGMSADTPAVIDSFIRGW